MKRKIQCIAAQVCLLIAVSTLLVDDTWAAQNVEEQLVFTNEKPTLGLAVSPDGLHVAWVMRLAENRQAVGCDNKLGPSFDSFAGSLRW